MSQPEMKCSERDETERDIPLMDLLDRWESPHKIQDKIQDFDAQMSGIKISKDDKILRPVYKKPFSEILSGCFHFWLFSS